MGALLCLAVLAALQVDLDLEPSHQIALVGETITVELVAEVTDDPEPISAIDAILTWDPNRLELLSASLGDFPPYVFGFLNDPDGINDDVTDGQAIYTVLTPPGAPHVVLGNELVASFEFEVLTSACVGLEPTAGVFGKTRVHGVVPGEEITGALPPDSVVEVPGTWVDIGGEAPGTGGLVPFLEGDGVLLECEPWELTLTDALPSTTSFLVIGLNTINLPLKGGILVPDLDIIRIKSTDMFGNRVIGGPWPPGVPGGISVYMQYWLFDTGAFGNYSASNAVRATTP